jgi:hypothetical protein
MIQELISPNVTKIVTPTWWSLGRIKTTNMDLEIKDGVYILDTLNQKIDTDTSLQNRVKNNLLIEVEHLFNTYEESGHLYPVSVTGLKDTSSGIGSNRFCNWDTHLAKLIDNAIRSFDILQLIEHEDYHNTLKYEGVSKYFRFMRYVQGGEHYPHYDSDFVTNLQDTRNVTAYTIVVYFTDCESGEICFVNDNRPPKFGKTDLTDWERQATDGEIWLKVKPRAGRIVMFPHTMCHTVLPYNDTDGQRIIARGDVVFSTKELV